MWCKLCNVLMNNGTEYEQKKNKRDKGYKRYNQCPKCHSKIYNKSLNFQEVMISEMEKNRNIRHK